MNRRGVIGALAAGLGGLIALPRSAASQSGRLTVFAAASLRDALDEVASGFDGPDAVASYAGSGTLARQIAAGAPANIFISANAAWMQELVRSGHVAADGPVDILTNRLVLVGTGPSEGRTLTDALSALGPDAFLATGFTRAVPAGIYARQALEALGLWEALSPRVVETENVRIALALAARGEVGAALVYHSDAIAEPGLTVLADVPTTLHDPIRYPAATIVASPSEAARAFLDHLSSDAARVIFRRHGFGIPA